MGRTERHFQIFSSLNEQGILSDISIDSDVSLLRDKFARAQNQRNIEETKTTKLICFFTNFVTSLVSHLVKICERLTLNIMEIESNFTNMRRTFEGDTKARLSFSGGSHVNMAESMENTGSWTALDPKRRWKSQRTSTICENFAYEISLMLFPAFSPPYLPCLPLHAREAKPRHARTFCA